MGKRGPERGKPERGDLSGANRSGADLSGAELSEANLTDANLSGADLSAVNLRVRELLGEGVSRYSKAVEGARVVSVDYKELPNRGDQLVAGE
jgi:uncharacterized protein YjbI with pentapeptide repeats